MHAGIGLTAVLLLSTTCAKPTSQPALVVMIAVDQLRADLLTRYDDLFTGGLRRLHDRGWRFNNAFHEHAITNTAPGHATLATGMHPSTHGIVDNDWLEKIEGRSIRVYSVGDSTVTILGRPDMEGASPHRLLAPTLAEWMQAADSATSVVSLGGKDRSTILMAGHARGHVYWFSSDGERFLTSSWFHDSYPEWLETFHREVMPQFCADSVWVSSVPEVARTRARVDRVPYEGRRGFNAFPHRLQDNFGNAVDDSVPLYPGWMRRTPFPDGAILALGKEAVRQLTLGADGTPDLLALALSQTDYIGHRFGPLSQEQLDNLLRLDRALGEFFDFLDSMVGENRWVVGLTADHGVCTAPEYLQETGQDARRVSGAEVDAVLEAVVEIERSEAESTTHDAHAAAAMERFDFVADAMTHTELALGRAGNSPVPSVEDSFVTLYRRSYHPERALTSPLTSRKHGSPGAYGLEVRLKECHVASTSCAVHGSPYLYDRHVPMIFMGANVPTGRTDVRVRSVDFAPTLAALAGVPIPPDLDGKPLSLVTAADR